MKILRVNLPWLVAAAATLVCIVVLLASGLWDRTAKDSNVFSGTTASAPVDRLAAFQEADQAATIPAQNTEPAEVDGQQIVQALVRATATSDVAEVTRNEPIALLETSTDVAPVAEPVAQTPSESSFDAASFFANAQANLAADDSCGEDLQSLVRDTKIYFPSGGLTAEASGLIKARVIGQLAGTCTGYTLQVVGHSDPSGNPAVNLDLSKKRAEAVIGMLSAGGINTTGFEAVGLGDAEPSNVTGPNSAAFYDRRVEFAVVKNTRTASLVAQPLARAQPWTPQVPECARALESKVAQTRLFYGPRAITVTPSELEVVYELADAVAQCEGARLRVVGQHSDQLGARESVETGRLRALVLMSSLVAAGYESEEILIGAPSYSVAVAGQPSLPNSRVDFQIISD